MRPVLAVFCLVVAVASQAFAVEPNRQRFFLAEMHASEGLNPHSSSVRDDGNQRASLLHHAAEFAAVQRLSSHFGREPAQINPEKAEDQYAERNQQQPQSIKEEAAEDQRGEGKHPDETLNETIWRWLELLWRYFWSVLFSMMVQLLLIILIAILYRHKIMIHGELDSYKQLDDFSSSLFACHEDLPICFWSCCCPAIRWGDTIGKMQWMGFWSAFFLFLLMIILLQVFTLAGLSLFIWIAFSVLLSHYRGRLRRDLNFVQESAFCLDTLVYACCQCCAIAQEARHVKLLLKPEQPA